MENVPYIDQTGLYTLEDVILSFEQKNIEVHLIGLNSQPGALLSQIGIEGLIGKEFIHKTFAEAIERARIFEEENA